MLKGLPPGVSGLSLDSLFWCSAPSFGIEANIELAAQENPVFVMLKR